VPFQPFRYFETRQGMAIFLDKRTRSMRHSLMVRFVGGFAFLKHCSDDKGDSAMRPSPTWILLALLLLTAASAPAGEKVPIIETIAGTGKPENNGASGPARDMNIGQPFGVEIGPDGALYITEVGNHRVLRLDRKAGTVKIVAGNGQKGYTGDGGPATEARLNEPYEVRFDRDGNMYFVEMMNHVVRRVDAKTGRISTIAGTGKPGFGGDGGPATAAQLRNPHSIVLDDQGNLYIADIGNHRVRRVQLNSGTVETIAGTGEKLPPDGATAKGSPIPGPRALAIDGKDLWIALREGHGVWHLDLKAGTLHHVAGTGKPGYSGDGGSAKRATFNGPKGIAVGPHGDLYVVDSENDAIRKIEHATRIITTVAGVGRARSYRGDGGPAVQATFSQPHGICVGKDGAIYIGDTGNHRVRKVQ
jgi:DNA-binding beta-propeller fold protein YncE